MQEKKFKEYYIKRGNTPEVSDEAVKAVKEWETQLKRTGKKINTATVEDLKSYIATLMEAGENTDERLLAITRYLHLTKKNEIYSHMAAVLGGRGVYDSISDRLGKIAGKKKQRQVFRGFKQPPLGSTPETYPRCTRDLLVRLNLALTPEQIRQTLAGNHHRIPAEEYTDMKKRYEAAKTMDEFLAGEHKRLVKELEGAMKSGRFWYEQEITPDVIEFVKNDQKIQNGVLEGDVVIKTKIPFNPKLWLTERDPKMKRYYACHCQLARSSILDGDSKRLEGFCYCSAGYEKNSLEVVLGVPLEVEVLESVLAGDDVCKFAIKIPIDKIK